MGRLLILCGVVLIIAGALFTLGERLPWLRLGRLPGDFSWTSSSGNVRIYVPLMTTLLLSALLTLVLWLLRR